ncbi:MAG: linear amide C-N hydrolase [Deltaproteobacteria bacterium]|nr:linear amide C-N hydrolase [Deltaproteobacteria bacterium]
MVFGKNFDWSFGSGLIIINKRGVKKTALLEPPEKPVRWVSQYGSITFNQVSKEFPFGGINEAGLVVEQMWLEETQYPGPDNRRVLSELQWIQYQLDNCRSVNEVFDSDAHIRISQNKSNIHFLVCDRSGNVAVIEFLNGKRVYQTGKNLFVKALTNDSYLNSMAYLKKHVGFGGKKEISSSPKSLDRFVRIAERLKDYKPNQSGFIVSYAFDILSYVSVSSEKSDTVWSIIYDLENLQIYFKTIESKDIKTLRLKDFDFRCDIPSKVLDINTGVKGDLLDHFVAYSTDINRKLVRSTFAKFKKTSVKSTENSNLEILIRYPSSVRCIR